MEGQSERETTIPQSEQVGISEPNQNDPPNDLKENRLKIFVESIFEGLPVTIVMSLFTIWALFSDDIRLAAAPKEADETFVIIISIAFFLFFIECLAGCYYKPGYLELPSFTPVPGETIFGKIKRICNLGSFYFWLDIIATVSLIFEVFFFFFLSSSSFF